MVGIVTSRVMWLAAAVVLGVLVLMVGQLETPKPGQAAFPGRNGKIAFVRSGGLSVVNPDGSGLRRITTKPVGDYFPAWSPSGKKLAFEASRYAASENAPFYHLDIYVMKSNGSHLKRVTKQPTTDDRMPSWSPNGKRIAFMRDKRSVAEPDTGDIYTIRTAGTELRQLTNKGQDEHPAWSPDGKTMAFDRIGRLTKANGERIFTGAIYTLNSEGGGLNKLTDPPKGFFDSQPSWSPDGTKIAFTRGSERRPDVFVMDADGTHVRKLTGKTEGAYSPDFSPDGEKIVFAVWEGESRLYVMNANGTNVQRLTKHPVSATQDDLIDDDAPDWQSLP